MAFNCLLCYQNGELTKGGSRISVMNKSAKNYATRDANIDSIGKMFAHFLNVSPLLYYIVERAQFCSSCVARIECLPILGVTAKANELKLCQELKDKLLNSAMLSEFDYTSSDESKKETDEAASIRHTILLNIGEVSYGELSIQDNLTSTGILTVYNENGLNNLTILRPHPEGTPERRDYDCTTFDVVRSGSNFKLKSCGYVQKSTKVIQRQVKNARKKRQAICVSTPSKVNEVATSKLCMTKENIQAPSPVTLVKKPTILQTRRARAVTGVIRKKSNQKSQLSVQPMDFIVLPSVKEKKVYSMKISVPNGGREQKISKNSGGIQIPILEITKVTQVTNSAEVPQVIKPPKILTVIKSVPVQRSNEVQVTATPKIITSMKSVQKPIEVPATEARKTITVRKSDAAPEAPIITTKSVPASNTSKVTATKSVLVQKPIEVSKTNIQSRRVRHSTLPNSKVQKPTHCQYTRTITTRRMTHCMRGNKDPKEIQMIENKSVISASSKPTNVAKIKKFKDPKLDMKTFVRLVRLKATPGKTIYELGVPSE